MPFDEDEALPSKQSQKIGLKQVSGQKSVFDNQPKKPTPEQFQEQVKEVSQRASGYKQAAAELAIEFNKAMANKTLPQNKSVFTNDAEQELLLKMVRLAQEVNADPNEREGEGSLSWIILLLKNCFVQRDKINRLEYVVEQLDKNLTNAKKEIVALTEQLDKIKGSV